MRPALAAALIGSQSASAAQFAAESLVALRLSNGGAALGTTTGNAVYLDEFSPSGSKLQTLAAPTSCTVGTSAQWSYIYEGRVTNSADSQLVSLTCYNATVGTSVVSAARQIFSVGVDGVLTSPIDTGLSGVAAFAAVKRDNGPASGHYHGGSGGLYFTSAGGGSSTLLNAYDATSIAIWANSLCECDLCEGGTSAIINSRTPPLSSWCRLYII